MFFLGMKLWFPSDGTVRIMMKEYIKEAIDLFGEKLNTSIATQPVCHYLYWIQTQ